MVFYNHRSLMISVKNVKYIHLLLIFSNCHFQSSSYWKYKPFINSFQFYLLRNKSWLSYFSEIESSIYYTIWISKCSAKYSILNGVFSSSLSIVSACVALTLNTKEWQVARNFFVYYSNSLKFSRPELNLQNRVLY